MLEDAILMLSLLVRDNCILQWKYEQYLQVSLSFACRQDMSLIDSSLSITDWHARFNWKQIDGLDETLPLTYLQ